MKNKLLRYSLLSMIAMLCGGGIFAIGQALSKAQENDPYTITFKETGTTSDGNATISSKNDIIDTGADYVSAITKASYVYKGRTGRGIKLGNGSNMGQLTFTLASPVKPSKIVVKARKYNDKGEDYININGNEFTLTSGDGDDCTINYDGLTEVSSIDIKTTTTDKKYRTYVISVTIYPAEDSGGGPSYYVVGEPSGLGLSWDPIAANKMEAGTTEGVYTKTYEGVVLKKDDKIEYKFISSDGTNTTYYPDGVNNNMTLPVNETAIYDVTFTFDVNNFDPTDTNVTVYNKRHTYTVAGALYDDSSTGKDDLFGECWQLLEDNQLALDGTTYTKKYENVELMKGTIYYKVVVDGVTWIPNNNIKVEITKAAKYDVTVTYNPDTQTPNMFLEEKGDASPAVASLQELQQKVTAASQSANLTFTNVIVTAVKGNNDAYLADANNEYGVLVHITNHGLQAGQVLNGTSLVDYTLYNFATEITSLRTNVLEITTGQVTPTEKTIADITTANQSTVVTLKGVTYDETNGVFKQGTNTIKYYDNFSAKPKLEDGREYDVTGVVVLYAKNTDTEATIEICPRTADDVVAKTFYITGDFQGTWSCSAPAEMTYNVNTKAFEYLLSATATAPMHFTIATGKANDWDTFKDNYRLGIGAGDQAVTVNTEYTLAKYSDGTMVISDEGRYIVRVTPDMKMTIKPWPIKTYMLQPGDTFTYGQTVNVEDDNEVVATIIYGEDVTDAKSFKAAAANLDVEGYVAYTEGNGENGNKTGGTFYTIVPKYDGEIEIAVAQNSGKKFYIKEDGTAMTGFNGTTKDEKYFGTYTFAVKAGSSYKFYCDGSKLGFYGFNYTYDKTYVVAGAVGNETESGKDDILFGKTWDVTANELTADATTGILSKVFENISFDAATTINYKIVKNGNVWIPAEANLTCAIPGAGKYNITVTFDPKTQTPDMQAVKQGSVEDTYVIAGAYGEDGTSEPGFFTTAWDATSEANKMTAVEGIYTKAYEDITIADNTTIYYKVVKNGNEWIPEGLGNNKSYTVVKGGKFNITFTYDPQAQENPITILIEATTEGDANLDGKVTTSDAVAAVSFALEKEEASAEQFKAADFNKNNVITVTDAVAIVNVALEEDPTGAAPMFDEGNNYLTLNGTALSLTNSTAFVAFQMDVTLTNGAVLNGVLPTERTQGLTLSFNRIGENTWRIVAFSIEKNAITGNEGDLLTFDITGSKTMAITNIEFADTYAIAYALGFNDGETTGIRPIDNGQLTIDNVIYDLNGRRVQNPSKGVYVINGKKVVVK